MAFHTYDVDRAEALEDEGRFEYCSGEELRAAIGPHSDMMLADLGSGTGFYTDLLAPVVDTCFAVDVQEGMHEFYRQKGIPRSVELVTADVATLPFADDRLDAAFSTMTFHEFATPVALEELRRILTPGGRLVTYDWTADGSGEVGPPLAERYQLAEAVDMIATAGFVVTDAETRHETFRCIARCRE